MFLYDILIVFFFINVLMEYVRINIIIISINVLIEHISIKNNW